MTVIAGAFFAGNESGVIALAAFILKIHIVHGIAMGNPNPIFS